MNNIDIVDEPVNTVSQADTQTWEQSEDEIFYPMADILMKKKMMKAYKISIDEERIKKEKEKEKKRKKKKDVKTSGITTDNIALPNIPLRIQFHIIRLCWDDALRAESSSWRWRLSLATLSSAHFTYIAERLFSIKHTKALQLNNVILTPIASIVGHFSNPHCVWKGNSTAPTTSFIVNHCCINGRGAINYVRSGSELVFDGGEAGHELELAQMLSSGMINSLRSIVNIPARTLLVMPDALPSLLHLDTLAITHLCDSPHPMDFDEVFSIIERTRSLRSIRISILPQYAVVGNTSMFGTAFHQLDVDHITSLTIEDDYQCVYHLACKPDRFFDGIKHFSTLETLSLRLYKYIHSTTRAEMFSSELAQYLSAPRALTSLSIKTCLDDCVALALQSNTWLKHLCVEMPPDCSAADHYTIRSPLVLPLPTSLKSFVWQRLNAYYSTPRQVSSFLRANTPSNLETLRIKAPSEDCQLEDAHQFFTESANLKHLIIDVHYGIENVVDHVKASPSLDTLELRNFHAFMSDTNQFHAYILILAKILTLRTIIIESSRYPVAQVRPRWYRRQYALVPNLTANTSFTFKRQISYVPDVGHRITQRGNRSKVFQLIYTR
ncbi:hypothetical protein SAMD00019534_112660 [Acytostelium subglobosum LB1]|uniref:hypothetical protein n=1 Tax=Acytostelium subglobosum LB1 TaxID=1410327 RepID=UPI0006448974|nr:hypothetical protein SAMD00019534_112660 [Acytostelium subglobosum LB1]GAM28090.1 hypothetical protein SAMD00019534_112660 [Acytostelium subglobosum LB1]|eukprot:XP_012749049.1 hypothetical protein SAMD00019534_112660 [Acytostelium subglobosum LB1]